MRCLSAQRYSDGRHRHWPSSCIVWVKYHKQPLSQHCSKVSQPSPATPQGDWPDVGDMHNGRQKQNFLHSYAVCSLKADSNDLLCSNKLFTGLMPSNGCVLTWLIPNPGPVQVLVQTTHHLTGAVNLPSNKSWFPKKKSETYWSADSRAAGRVWTITLGCT